MTQDDADLTCESFVQLHCRFRLTTTNKSNFAIKAEQVYPFAESPWLRSPVTMNQSACVLHMAPHAMESVVRSSSRSVKDSRGKRITTKLLAPPLTFQWST